MSNKRSNMNIFVTASLPNTNDYTDSHFVMQVKNCKENVNQDLKKKKKNNHCLKQDSFWRGFHHISLIIIHSISTALFPAINSLRSWLLFVTELKLKS